MKKGCIPTVLGILLFIDASLSVMLGLGSVFDYAVITISISIVLPLIVQRIRQELRIRKRMKEIRESRECACKEPELGEED